MSPQGMREWAAPRSCSPRRPHPPSFTPHPYTHVGPSCCLSFWAGCQNGEVAPGAPRGWDRGKAREGGLHSKGAQSVLVRMRGWGEPESGWAVSLSREKERKTTLSIELKIELRASQGCGLGGGRILLPGAEELWQALAREGGAWDVGGGWPCSGVRASADLPR